MQPLIKSDSPKVSSQGERTTPSINTIFIDPIEMSICEGAKLLTDEELEELFLQQQICAEDPDLHG